MNVAGFAGFDDDRSTHPLANAVQMVVDRADRQQGRNRDSFGGGGAVGEDQNAVFRLNGGFRFCAKLIQSCFQASVTGRQLPGAIEHGGKETVFTEILDALEFVLEKDRTFQADTAAMRRGFLENIAFWSEAGTQRHHGPLADRVDRRVGDLGEELLKVGVEKAGIGG